ncbi:putative domain XH [Sesbania bispinosa]|nr:putative domain XH [Sesbania bispinosa]
MRCWSLEFAKSFLVRSGGSEELDRDIVKLVRTLMSNHSYEDAVSQQSKAFVSLETDLEKQKQKIIDMEQRNREKDAHVNKAFESLNLALEIMKAEYTLQKVECQEELEKIKVINFKMNLDMGFIKKEHGQITKELEESKALNDLQKKNFAEENQKVLELVQDQKNQNQQLNDKIIQLQEQLKSKQKLELENQQLKGKLYIMKDDFQKMVGALHMDIREKEQSLQDLDALNQTLIIKERELNDELQEARRELINRLITLANIGVKRMGELDTGPFLEAMKKRYNEVEAEKKASEMCSLWEEYLKDANWHPFKVVNIEGKEKEIISDDDEKLKGLKNDMGEGAYKAVVAALIEINEYNPSGRAERLIDVGCLSIYLLLRILVEVINARGE